MRHGHVDSIDRLAVNTNNVVLVGEILLCVIETLSYLIRLKKLSGFRNCLKSEQSMLKILVLHLLGLFAIKQFNQI